MKAHQIRLAKFQRPINGSSFTPFLNKLSQNSFILVSKSSAYLSELHLAALLRVLKFHFKRKTKDGRFFINFKLCSDLTRKAIGVRMGKGKGPLSGKVFFLRPGFTLCFISHQSKSHAQYILSKCIRKLPVSCRMVSTNNW